MVFQNILDPPRIESFQGAMSSTDSMTLTCVAEGLPRPTYAIFSDGTVLKEESNGVVTIRNYTSDNDATYKCIARNHLGSHLKELSLHSFKG